MEETCWSSIGNILSLEVHTGAPRRLLPGATYNGSASGAGDARDNGAGEAGTLAGESRTLADEAAYTAKGGGELAVLPHSPRGEARR